MELVTEPVIHDSKQAGDFARELQLLLRYLGASEANMEERADACRGEYFGRSKDRINLVQKLRLRILTLSVPLSAPSNMRSSDKLKFWMRVE